MYTLKRDNLVQSINAAADKEIMIPAMIFGRPALLKTTKKDIVSRILSTFSNVDDDTGVKLRKSRKLNALIIDSVGVANNMMNGTEEKNASADNTVKRGRGRPVGSKDKQPRAPRGSRQEASAA